MCPNDREHLLTGWRGRGDIRSTNGGYGSSSSGSTSGSRNSIMRTLIFSTAMHQILSCNSVGSLGKEWNFSKAANVPCRWLEFQKGIHLVWLMLVILIACKDITRVWPSWCVKMRELKELMPFICGKFIQKKLSPQTKTIHPLMNYMSPIQHHGRIHYRLQEGPQSV